MSRRIKRPDEDWGDDFPEELNPSQVQEEVVEESVKDEVKPPKKRMRVKKNVETQMPVNSSESDSQSKNQSDNQSDSSSTDTSAKPSDLLASLLRKIPQKNKTIEGLSQKSKTKTAQQLSLQQHLCRPVVIYTILFVVILLNALWVVNQSYYYRLDYLQLNALKAKTKELETERGKMLIEKQTFGSSGQIATRATMQMGMFLPSNQQRIVIQVPKNVGTQNHDE